MKKQTLKSAEQARIVGSGEKLTIETTADFAQRIRKELTGATTVVVEFEPVVELDITALQVLCSACKTAAAEGKKFTHRGPIPQALVDLAGAVGSAHHAHCTQNNMTCFFSSEAIQNGKAGNDRR